MAAPQASTGSQGLICRCNMIGLTGPSTAHACHLSQERSFRAESLTRSVVPGKPSHRAGIDVQSAGQSMHQPLQNRPSGRSERPDRVPTVKRKRVSASFKGLRAASPEAGRIASSASRKQGTRCEVRLRQSLRKLGLRFAANVASLPGCPDVVFRREKVVVFADGDFWHGRHLADRVARLSRGHNSVYWIRKIQSNVARDRRIGRQLSALGWRVVRVWESDINSQIERAIARILRVLQREV